MNTRLKVTVPREPALETAHRAQRHRFRNNLESGEHEKSKAPPFKARPLNSKILKAPSLPPQKKKSRRQSSFFQVFHLNTSERAMQHSSVHALNVQNSESILKLGTTENERLNGEDARKHDNVGTIKRVKARPLNKKIVLSKSKVVTYQNVKEDATADVSPEYFFGGVCCGGLITFPLQLRFICRVHFWCCPPGANCRPKNCGQVWRRSGQSEVAIAFSQIVILRKSPPLTVVIRNYHNNNSHPKEAAAMSNGGTLPLEILTDILSRLPIKSLCRLKCASPSWKSLISSPHFAQTHLNRTNSQNLNPNLKIILVSTSHALYSVDFTDANPTAKKLAFPSAEQHSDKWVQVFSSSNGLVLVSDENDSNLVLLNPSTRECKKLPPLPVALNPAHRGFHLSLYGVSYDSSRNDYKVLMLCRNITVTEFGLIGTESPTGSDTRVALVYSLKTDAWQRIQDIQYCTPGKDSTRVLVNGCLHSACWSRNESHVIAAFDWSDETFREVPLPASFQGFMLMYCELAVIGGCLCLITRFSCSSEVWMMKEYGVRESWTKFMIDPGMSPGRLWCSFSENELLLKSNEQKLVVFNSEKETLRDMVVCGIPPEFTFGGTYVESLVSLHQGGGIERL